MMIMGKVFTPTFFLTAAATEFPIAFRAYGSIAKTRTYQMAELTVDGNMDHRRRAQIQYPYVKPEYSGTEAQLAQRQRCTDASAAWKLLSPEEQEIYNARAELEYQNRNDKPGSYRYHNGRHLFMGPLMKAP